MAGLVQEYCKTNDLVLLSTVAKNMNLPYSRLYHWAHKGRIKYKRVSKKMLVDAAEADRCMELAREKGWIE